MMLDLKRLKREPLQAEISCSWAYIAGFFDAEGCIVLPRRGQLRLEISQNNLATLTSIQRFLLESEFAYTAPIYAQASGVYKLTVSRNLVGKGVLQKLLCAGLCVKRNAAERALEICTANYNTLRMELLQMSGNQARYQRLDTVGRQRANNIIAAQLRLKRSYASGDCPKTDELHQQLVDLQRSHKLISAADRYALLRQDIRSLLRQGAMIQKEHQQPPVRNVNT
ncbi:unnamed protein product [Polarella glacialis]|uniref:Homing endonuclease LAGLIDADG domain-containing protein n=1 Tax=Polarella glacialis TaxID=89957 RepID=A0A813F2P9_POLGL|nr:unnamed protein product [Polarella glacialis]